MAGRISIDAPPQDFRVRHILGTVRSWLNQNDIEVPLLERVELSLAEVFNNIEEHGGGPTTIKVQGHCNPLYIRIHIYDYANEIPQQFLERTAPMPEAQGTAPEGGFGWPLIHMLTDRISYARIKDQNRLELQFERDPEISGLGREQMT